MIKKIDLKQDKCLYCCKEGDTLTKVAQAFGVTTDEILRLNPLFSEVYAGCLLYIEGMDRLKIVVKPMQTLATIAKENHTTIESIMKLNDLKSDKVFVGMQLYVERGDDCEKNIV